MVSGQRKLATKRARDLRKRETSAESLLWSELRGRRADLPKFRRQHPVPPYILDFACRPLKLAVEIDGGTHSTQSEIRHDQIRTQFLKDKGWTIVRYTNTEVYNELDDIVSDIYHKIHSQEKT